jgi:carbonic anhydrase/acetyltransferase-like protein (isoleucine patch superfamily)
VVRGDVSIGPGSRVLDLVVLQGELGPVTIGADVFIATGVSMFPGSRAGAGSELRIRSSLHVNSRLEPGTTVPIGWIAAGDPAELFSPDRHDELWAVQEPLDFPGTVYGVPRGTPMREIMHRQSEAFRPGR